MLYKNKGHTNIIRYYNADLAGTPSDKLSKSSNCVFIRRNLITYKSKKQNIVARSNIEVRY
ncbi:hypothetical protein OC709_01915 ['Planchonia careya' phytoplasma]|nr:hypothetical protein ['Planchonia careya' phytoplasma]MDO8030258.1 hypothetical protein ['Planchonia careya' phytoplasma]